jgi:hypothetical protein
MDRFETKKDSLIKAIIFGPTIIVTVFTFIVITKLFNINIPVDPLILITVLFWTYLLIVWRFTYYELKQDKFIARFAYFASRKVNVNDIVEIKSKYSGGRIYGLSFDIVSLKLRNGKKLNISPVDKERLIKEIEKRKTIANTVYAP